MKHVPPRTIRLNPSAQPGTALRVLSNHNVCQPHHRGQRRGPPEPSSFPAEPPSLTPAMKLCGDPSAPQLLGIPAVSPGYLHPARLLETGLSCLPDPTLFLLRSQLALCLSPFSIIIIPSMEKLLAAGQRQGCPQRHFPSWNTPPLLRCSSTWTSPHRFHDK